tara:strand:- start:168 stop:341 length:174 start_codon:yes stop_codon:yes gene_type:complete
MKRIILNNSFFNSDGKLLGAGVIHEVPDDMVVPRKTQILEDKKQDKKPKAVTKKKKK